MSVQVFSEIGHLRRVVVHQPGLEVLRMTHAEMERLLFDDILAMDAAVAEHALMGEILRAHGAEVLDLLDLLADGLARAPREAILDLLERVAEQAGEPVLAEYLGTWEPRALAEGLVHGVSWDDLAGAPLTLARLRDRLRHQAPLALRPVPNLLFMRDPCIPVYDRVVVARMATEARAREPLLGRFALEHAPFDVPLLFDGDDRTLHPVLRSIEGGDVLVGSPRFLVIGCSERTTPQTVERLARDFLFPTFPALERVYAVLMPPERSVMHLDTVLTQVDQDLFIGHVPMVSGRPGHEPLAVAVLGRGQPPRRVPGGLLDVLRAELGADVEVAPCGGYDPLHQEREQWTDGANAVCLSPGHIVLYSRNVRTIAVLCEEWGFEQVEIGAHESPDERAARLAESLHRPRVIYTFGGHELSRARGGARCMTMPLVRDALGEDRG